MKKTTLNIGLENNVKFDPSGGFESVVKIVDSLSNIGNVTRYRIDVGEYNGQPERTLVAVFDSLQLDYVALEAEIGRLCDDMTQECIAYSSGHTNTSALVWCTEFASNEGTNDMLFDHQYFIEY